jgi:hypothetical protein
MQLSNSSPLMHRNDKRNTDEYHLYRIWDREAEEPFKFGISADEINPKDGLSKRIRSQVNLFNRVVGSLRFFWGSTTKRDFG